MGVPPAAAGSVPMPTPPFHEEKRVTFWQAGRAFFALLGLIAAMVAVSIAVGISLMAWRKLKRGILKPLAFAGLGFLFCYKSWRYRDHEGWHPDFDG